MHRTLLLSQIPIGIVLGALLTAGVARPIQGADPMLPPPKTDTQAAHGSTVMVPIGSSQRLQMKDKKVIQTVVNPKENVALVQPIQDDPRTVLITGREAGVTRITLTAADNTQETYEIVVQFDIEYLRALLTRAVPTASLQLIPASSGVIIISGNVAHSEDIDTIMRAAQSVVSSPDRIINAMRVGGVMEVQLDVVIAFVSRTGLRRMSFDFVSLGKVHDFASTVGGALQLPVTGQGVTLSNGVLTVMNTVTAPNGAPANFFLSLFNDNQLFLGLLQALRNENLAKILAQPKLVTLSGRSARLLSGGQQAIPETAGLGSVSVRFEPFGTQLSVLPIVMGNGKIYMEIEPEVSNIDPSVGTTIAGTSVPGRSTQSVHTTVEMEDGQTLAIGGLIQNTITASTQKVPVLGDLPFLGAAFSSKSFSETESELVIMVTPHVVDAMACDQLPKYLPGQETRSPDDYELFLEGILEAPRGQRDVFPGGHFVPAYKNSPTADRYPCGDPGNGCTGSNGTSCTTGASGGEGNGGAGLAAAPATPATSPVAVTDPKPTVLPSATDGGNK
jgi:pilus assembly protein CpaC